MNINYKKTIGTPILHFSNGGILGIMNDVIIDPDTGKVEAFWIKPFTVPIKNAIIQSQDIIKWKKKIYVKDDSVISDPADVIKISEILTKQSFLIGDSVKNENGDYLGRIHNIDFDTKTFYVKHIYVKKSFLFANWSRRLIPFDRIIEILPSLIIVNDDTRKKKGEKLPAKSGSMNPVG